MKARDRDALVATLKARFEQNMHRHQKVAWRDVAARLAGNAEALDALQAMEESGGEPDVVGAEKSGRVTFFDCSAESPAGRRSLCFDEDALAARKQAKPRGSALGMAAEMGIELLTESEYGALQELGEFDLKTSSWIQTPPEMRALGGSLFGDRRFGRVFTYHNGAQSYYGARGFRARLRV